MRVYLILLIYMGKDRNINFYSKQSKALPVLELRASSLIGTFEYCVFSNPLMHS
jgi:hypothetical protein